MARNRAPRNRGREEEEEEEMSKQNGEKGNNQNVGSPPMGLVRELKDYSEQEIYEFLQECNMSYWEDEAMALVWALKDKWSEYPEERIYQVLKECNMSYWEADKKLFRQDTRNRMLNEVHFYDDQLLEVKSEHEKEIQEAIDKRSSSSSCDLGQGDSTPLCTSESELLSSEDHKEFLAASGLSVLEPPISSKPYSDLGSQLSYLQTERSVILKNHNEVFLSENSAASGPSVLEPPTTCKPCSDLGWQLSDLRVGQDAIVKDHNEDPVPISSVKTQASSIAASPEDDYHKEFPAASGSSALEYPISSEPSSDLGSRLSYLQITRGVTVKNHNDVSRSENSAASIPSVLGPTTTSKPCSDLGSQSSDLQVGRDAFVKDHNEGTVGDSCKSLPNNSSVSGIGATEALPNTNTQNLCLGPSASNLPESLTNLNAAQANSQVHADAQEYDPWTFAHQPVEIVLEVHLTRRAGVIIVLLGVLLVLLRTMGVRATTDHYDSNSQYNGSRNFPSSSQGGSIPVRRPNNFQQSQQDLPQSQMESTQQQEQNPGRSLEDSNLRQSRMGASQGYQDQTTSSDTTCGDFEAPSHGQPRQPQEH